MITNYEKFQFKFHVSLNLYMYFAARDERLSSYALIARAAAAFTIPLLTRLLSERFALLHQVTGILACENFRSSL